MSSTQTSEMCKREERERERLCETIFYRWLLQSLKSMWLVSQPQNLWTLLTCTVGKLKAWKWCTILVSALGFKGRYGQASDATQVTMFLFFVVESHYFWYVFLHEVVEEDTADACPGHWSSNGWSPKFVEIIFIKNACLKRGMHLPAICQYLHVLP